MNFNLFPVPFDAAVISATHSAVTGVLAGFALAAVFLLIDHARNAEVSEVRTQYGRAMLLLFVAFMLGTLASFLFSSVSGDESQVAYYGFEFPGVLFAVDAIVLMNGMTVVFAVLGIKEIFSTARLVSYLAVFFAISRICTDMMLVSGLLAFPTFVKSSVILIAVVPVLASLLVIRRIRSVQNWLERHSFRAFCVTAVVGAFLTAVGHGLAANYAIANKIFFYPTWLPVAFMGFVSVLGAWSIVLTPTKVTDSAPPLDYCSLKVPGRTAAKADQ